jgi:MraZ protein
LDDRKELINQENQASERTRQGASFRGNFAHALDEKGRVSLPVEFRRILSAIGDQSVVLTNYISDGARCLEGFGATAWLNFEGKLRSKSRFSAKLQKLENFYLSRASECPVDGSGRILIPTYLRAYAAIDREVTFTSSIHGFRVWDTRVWSTIFAAAEEALMSNPDLFSDVDL